MGGCRGALAALVLGVPALWAGSAAGQDGMTWFYGRYDDESGGASSHLTYGIPETDALQFQAWCDAGPGGGMVVAAFGLDPGDHQEGEAVEFGFDAADFTGAFNGVRPGEIFGLGNEEGLVGVRVPLDAEDDFWAGLRAGATLSYAVIGLPWNTLPLQGSSEPAGRFLEDCRLYAAGGRPQAPAALPAAAAPVAAPNAGCSFVASLRSVTGGGAVTVTFLNRTDGHRGVAWIDFDGVPQSYGALNPGESFSVLTAVGHPWMITDGPGNCLELFMPEAGLDRFDITAPAADFGPE